jgi:hypothetical protein
LYKFYKESELLVRFKYYCSSFIFGDSLEITSKSNNAIETALDRIRDNEDKVIKAHSFFYKILRKANAYDENSIAKGLLDDFMAIRENREAEFEYASRNMLDPAKQFELNKLDKLYGKEYSANIFRLESSGESINQFQNSPYTGNFPGQTIYVCKHVPHTESNIEKADKVVGIAIEALLEKLKLKKELL